MTLQSFNRWTAFGAHLALSALIAATVVGLVMWLWYPAPYFSAMGGATLLRLLIGVDVALGPLITLIIFDRSKPRLAQDLAIVACLQVAALAYGSYIMFEARPVYSVFVKDRFEVVAANDVDAGSLGRAAAAFQALPLDGPRIVAANPPADRREAATIAMSAMMGGPDVAHLPHLYEPYAQAAGNVARVSRPLVALSQKGQESATAINDFVTANGNVARTLGYIPVKARNRDFAAVVDRKSGEIVGYLAVNPW
jgi:hypothetical protein